jgi:hypothetical protein
VLARAVSAHELLPVAALADGGPTRREVTLAVEVGHLPPGVDHGSLVEVWTTPAADAGSVSTAVPQRILGAAPVAAVDTDAGGLGTSGTTVGVVLAVDVDDVAAVVAAARTGAIDLVLVPSS